MTSTRHARVPVALALAAALTTACASPLAMTTDHAPWFDTRYSPPTGLTTSRVHLEPLAPRHAELDFAAIMGSREHLHDTLRWGDWPRADFTVEENRADLERHWQEFVDREGYAYTVLTPDRTRCVGCVYLEPTSPRETPTTEAALAYWVVEDELASDLDRHMLFEVIAWIERDWAFDRVVIPTHRDDRRGQALAASLVLAHLGNVRFAQESSSDDHDVTVWQR